MTFKADPPTDWKTYEKDLDLFNDPFSSSSVTQMIPEGPESSGHLRRFRLVTEIGVRSNPSVSSTDFEPSRSARFVSRFRYCETLSRTVSNILWKAYITAVPAFVRDFALLSFQKPFTTFIKMMFNLETGNVCARVTVSLQGKREFCFSYHVQIKIKLR